MRLIDLISRTALTEMFVRYRPDPDQMGSHNWVIAHRDSIWVLPGKFDASYDEKLMDVFDDIRTRSGIDITDDQDIDDAQESRPDVLVANYDPQGQYLLITSHEIAHHPVASGLIKKVAKQLGVTSVTKMSTGGEDEIEYRTHQLQGRVPDVLYHGTTSDKALRILRQGLRTNMRDQSKWAKAGIVHQDIVFLTAAIDYAGYHANLNANADPFTSDQYIEMDDPYPVVLEMKIPDPTKIVPDYDVAANMIGHSEEAYRLGYTDIDGYSKFPPKLDDIRKFNPGSDLTKNQGIYGYRGRIPPTHIIGVHTNFWEGAFSANQHWSGTPKEWLQYLNDVERELYGDDEDDEDEWN